MRGTKVFVLSAFLIVSVKAFVTPNKIVRFAKNKNQCWGLACNHERSPVTVPRFRTLLSMSSDTDTVPKQEKGNGYNTTGNYKRNWRAGGKNDNKPPKMDSGDRGSYNGGGGYTLILKNPLKVQRIKVQPAPDTSGFKERQKESRVGQDSRLDGSRVNPSRSVESVDSSTKPKKKTVTFKGSEVEDESESSVKFRPVFDATNNDKGPRRNFGTTGKKTKKEKDQRTNSDDDGQRRTSLRIGSSSKKGRTAEMNMQRGSLKKRDKSKDKESKEARAMERRKVVLPEGPLTVSQLAEIIEEKPIAVIKFLMTDLGIMASMTHSLDTATCAAVCEGFGKIIYSSDDDDDDSDYDDDDVDFGGNDHLSGKSALEVGYADNEDDPISLVPRPPVITIMGHVDHGKTSLLDTLRNTKVVLGEAGGITQHIAAYQIEQRQKKITFIDTPGHAAFADMRQRGANITDIVILVVAADDGVKQQTADSIACARQAGVPIVVAINKIDLPTADISRVKSDLTAYDVLTEDLGGDVLCSEISAKKKIGIDDLLEKVLLQAEILDLKANPDRKAQGIVVEARVERGFGTVATTLIKKGTLKIGDVFVAGSTYGRVKTLISTDGKTKVKEASPGTPVNVVGFDGVPCAGESLVVCENEQIARELAESRARITRERQAASYQAGLLQSVTSAFAAPRQRREMCVVVKADVQGSAEALTRALRELKLENDEAIVSVKVLVSEAGEVSKSDVAIASVTPGTTIIAFGCSANYNAIEDARQLGIPIEYYDIVYDAIESVQSRMQEILSPTPEGEYVGSAIVQQVFNIGGVGNIAGSKCRDGYLKKGSNVRVMRGDKILCESRIKTLRNFKAEVDSIKEGDECGIGLTDFETFQSGDVIESYVEQK